MTDSPPAPPPPEQLLSPSQQSSHSPGPPRVAPAETGAQSTAVSVPGLALQPPLHVCTQDGKQAFPCIAYRLLNRTWLR